MPSRSLVVRRIDAGLHDDELLQIIEAAVFRGKGMARNRLLTLQVGDKVRFVPGIRPSYLAGAHATVVDKLRTRIVVKLDHPTGRFLSRIRTSASLIELIPATEVN